MDPENTPYNSTQKISYSAMYLGTPLFEVGKKLASSANVKVEEAFLVQLSSDGVGCDVGQNSACHSADCNFLNVVKLASSKPGWPGNVTIEQPLVCRTEWIAAGATSGYEQLANCRVNGAAAAAPNPSASPSPCLGDIDFDGHTTPMEYDIVRASKGLFAGSNMVACDYLRLFKAMDLNNDNAIGPEDWAPLKSQVGCSAPIKRCFNQSPAYFIWQKLIEVWSSNATAGLEYQDLAAVEFCNDKPPGDDLPKELQPSPNPTPAKTCGDINIDGHFKKWVDGGVLKWKTIDSRDVFLAHAIAKLYPTGPEYPASCPSGLPSFDTTGLSCDPGIQPAPTMTAGPEKGPPNPLTLPGL
jgi:hypothetical protein